MLIFSVTLEDFVSSSANSISLALRTPSGLPHTLTSGSKKEKEIRFLTISHPVTENNSCQCMCVKLERKFLIIETNLF